MECCKTSTQARPQKTKAQGQYQIKQQSPNIQLIKNQPDLELIPKAVTTLIGLTSTCPNLLGIHQSISLMIHCGPLPIENHCNCPKEANVSPLGTAICLMMLCSPPKMGQGYSVNQCDRARAGNIIPTPYQLFIYYI